MALEDGSSVVAWDIDPQGNRRLTVAHVPVNAIRPRSTVLTGSDGSSYPQLAPLKNGGAAIAWTQLKWG